MNIRDLQTRLGVVADGVFGPLTRAALMDALRGDIRPLAAADVAEVAKTLSVDPAKLWAVADVESSGRGFDPNTRLPLILYEPHIFSRRTGGVYDGDPTISYRRWKTAPYPRKQADRYAQLIKAAGRNLEAAFASASWGAFQIMGFNAGLCGRASSVEFALEIAKSEKAQLLAAARFIKARSLDDELRRGDWDGFALGFNGSGYKVHRYDEKLEAAYMRRAA